MQIKRYRQCNSNTYLSLYKQNIKVRPPHMAFIQHLFELFSHCRINVHCRWEKGLKMQIPSENNYICQRQRASAKFTYTRVDAASRQKGEIVPVSASSTCRSIINVNESRK